MGSSDDEDSFYYTTRRLMDAPELNLILKHNLDNIETWKIRYPHHDTWIRETIKSIQADDYALLAFGVFIHGGDDSSKLVCSAIVKKDLFGPYLKIKNLTLLQVPTDVSCEALQRHRQTCYRRMIKHIQRFAESRGYTKLITELFNRNNGDRDLIQEFLHRGFDVAGSRTRHYKANDEIIILSFDVDPIYGLDPYDFASAAKWLVKRHIPGFDVKERGGGEGRDLEVSVRGKVTFSMGFVEISSHREGSEALRKFAFSCYILVIPSYLAVNKSLAPDDELDVRFNLDTHGRIYVFDFTLGPHHEQSIWERQLLPKIRQREKDSVYFSRDELNQLLYGAPSAWNHPERRQQKRPFRVTADLPPAEVAGLLTLADPARLDVAKVADHYGNSINSIYIKLGPKGKRAIEGQILAFYYPAEDSSSDAMVWGYAEIVGVVYVNIDELRSDRFGNLSDAEVLFNHLEDSHSDDAQRAVPIWDRAAFEKHNKYNATKEVVCFYLGKFFDLRQRPMRLDWIVTGEGEQSEFRRQAIVKEIDAYLSTTEARGLRKHAEAEVPPSLSCCTWQFPGPPYTVVCVWSSPTDQGRIEYEGNTLSELVRGRDRFAEVVPAINVNYLGLGHVVREAKPHLIHLSGHCEPDGLKFCSSDKSESWSLSGDEFQRILSESSRTFLVVLNCCRSDQIARAISRGGRFAIGFRDELYDDDAQSFTRYYMGELIKGFDGVTLREKLCLISRGFSQENRRAYPTVWFDGIELK